VAHNYSAATIALYYKNWRNFLSGFEEKKWDKQGRSSQLFE